MPLSEALACGNCGGPGWHALYPLNLAIGERKLVWSACADCNDDGNMPKPELCEGCGETEPFCGCDDAN
jgi:hypothetical protein